jgi:hypothetical protein
MVITWTLQTLSIAANFKLNSVAYGNGLFVAVGQLGNVWSSPDGINWTQQISGTTTTLTSVCFGDGKFVACRTSNQIFQSTNNGINWTITTLSSTFNKSWTSIAYGSGYYVAVAAGGGSMTSQDGTTWSLSNTLPSQIWLSVAYGLVGGVPTFVAVSTTSSLQNIAYSTDGGSNWTLISTRPGSASNTFNSITFGNGLFVAVGYDFIITSPNGFTWTNASGYSSVSYNAIAYGNGYFVASTTDSSNASVGISTDGQTWTSQTAPTLGGTYSGGLGVAFNSTSNVFAIVGNDRQIMTSSAFPNPCFVKGTRILTDVGYKCIEDITTNDLIITHTGKSVKVEKVRMHTTNVKTKSAIPYLIPTNSLNATEDLYVSKHHALLMSDGIHFQTPKQMGFKQSTEPHHAIGNTVTYYHIKTPNYFQDTLMANGVISETWSDMKTCDICKQARFSIIHGKRSRILEQIEEKKE